MGQRHLLALFFVTIATRLCQVSPRCTILPWRVMASGRKPVPGSLNVPNSMRGSMNTPITTDLLSAASPAQPGWTASPVRLYEVGMTTAAMSYHTAAIEALRECTALAPNHAPAWLKLAELLRLAKEDAEADAAEAAAQLHAGVKWKKGLDERTAAQLHKGERKLLDPLRNKPEEDAAATLREHLVTH